MSLNFIAKKKEKSLLLNGWHILAANLGPWQAFKFLSLIKTDFDDSVEAIKKLWKGKTVKEIGKEIQQAREKGII